MTPRSGRIRPRVGRRGLDLGPLSLGTGSLGGLHHPVSAEAFAETVASALRLGIRTFDTAPIYGLGVSEQRLGAALRHYPRDALVVSTKIGRLLHDPCSYIGNAEIDNGYDGAWHGVPPQKIVVDFSYDATFRSVSESLERLGLDRIDIVYIHDTFEEHHYRSSMEGAYRALDKLRREGAIGAIGVGIGHIDKLRRFAADGDFDCFLVAGRYTLLDHTHARELLTACERRNITIVLGGVFNSGLLADPYCAAPLFDYRPAPPELVARTRELDRICRAHGVPLKAAALQFPLAHPAVATVLLGAATPSELEENVRLADLPISDVLWSDMRTAGLLSSNAVAPVAR